MINAETRFDCEFAHGRGEDNCARDPETKEGEQHNWKRARWNQSRAGAIGLSSVTARRGFLAFYAYAKDVHITRKPPPPRAAPLSAY